MSDKIKQILIYTGVILGVLAIIFGILCFISWICQLIINGMFSADANFWAVFGVVCAIPVLIFVGWYLAEKIQLKLKKK